MTTTHWTDAPHSAVALVRASITYDQEAEDVLSRYADDHVHDWLVVFARSWLLDAAGIRDLPPIRRSATPSISSTA
jgi:1,2-phenylacetyl-CoA epoxidase catalytic subunit